MCFDYKHLSINYNGLRLYFQVMQKLGKANETKDLTFDEFVANFNKQQV